MAMHQTSPPMQESAYEHVERLGSTKAPATRSQHLIEHPNLCVVCGQAGRGTVTQQDLDPSVGCNGKTLGDGAHHSQSATLGSSRRVSSTTTTSSRESSPGSSSSVPCLLTPATHGCKWTCTRTYLKRSISRLPRGISADIKRRKVRRETTAGTPHHDTTTRCLGPWADGGCNAVHARFDQPQPNHTRATCKCDTAELSG